MMYRHAHARIGPIVRRVRNPPIRIAYIYPCDSAGCRNELLCTNSQTDYIDGFEQGGKRLGDETSVSEQKGVMQWTGIELGARPKFKIQRSKFKILTIY